MARVSERRLHRDNAASARRHDSIDRWCNRAGQLSQVLLLLLGIFGYFYTVLPVYQKSLLDEDIAKKTIELGKKDAELTGKASELNEKMARIAELTILIDQRTAALKEKDKQVEAAESSLKIAKHEKDLAKSQALVATLEGEVTYIKLRREYLGAVTADIRSCGHITRLRLAAIDWREPPELAADSLDQCLRSAVNKSKSYIGQLKPTEYPMLQAGVEKVAPPHRKELALIVARLNERITALTNELLPLEEAYKATQKLDPLSPESQRARTAYFGRGSALNSEVRAVRKEAGDHYMALLDKLNTDLWAVLWKGV
ncbi:hypothetical protein ACSFBF_12735 [Variovorax sp. ZT5P49]|uniref:hypothetical protein n=1 Tax=Variovorax sp. ZT5P49 TaxID=3443733 RepID=UPI003F4888D5